MLICCLACSFVFQSFYKVMKEARMLLDKKVNEGKNVNLRLSLIHI